MSNKIVEPDGSLIKNLQQPLPGRDRVSDRAGHTELFIKDQVELNTDLPAKNSDLCVLAERLQRSQAVAG
jgi:hypothetical protein